MTHSLLGCWRNSPLRSIAGGQVHVCIFQPNFQVWAYSSSSRVLRWEFFLRNFFPFNLVLWANKTGENVHILIANFLLPCEVQHSWELSLPGINLSPPTLYLIEWRNGSFWMDREVRVGGSPRGWGAHPLVSLLLMRLLPGGVAYFRTNGLIQVLNLFSYPFRCLF